MSIDPRRRAKQLARKAAKRKAQLAARKRNDTGSGAVTSFARWPVYECYMPRNLFEIGLGNVVVSRKMGDRIAAAVFLVDTGCLGVKDTVFKIVSAIEFRYMLDKVGGHGEMIPVGLECARKLVEGAVEYASGLGFKPHKSYHKTRAIFGGADKTLCETVFEFGRDGKPFYCSGPGENAERRRQILEILRERCGPDGFHYVVGIVDPSLEEYDPEVGEEETDTFEF